MCMEFGERREREIKLELAKESQDLSELKQRADICHVRKTTEGEGPLRKQYRYRKTCAC